MDASEFLFGQAWALKPDTLDAMLAIAERRTDVEALITKTGRPLDNARKVTMRDGVAVIPVRGVVSRYANLFTMVCGGTSLDVLASDFRTALDSPEVKSIVLEIDSPGGQAAGIGEFAAQVRAGSKIKPVVSYVSNEGASAAYWIASAASRIVVAPSAMLGSVGAVLTLAKDKTDGRVEIVSTQSPHKRPDVATKEGRAQFQKLADDLAGVFVADVAAYRGVAVADVLKDFGAGGMLIGADAVAAGMADQVGTLETLIDELSHGGPAEPVNPPAPGGSAAADTRKDRPTNMAKFSFASLYASWVKGGMKDEVEVPATAAADDATATPTGSDELYAISASNPAAGPQKVVFPTAAGPSQREKELMAEVARLNAAAAARLDADAVAWFDAQLTAGTVLPTDKESSLAFYAEFARLDASHPSPHGISRLGGWKAAIEAKKPHGLTTEHIPSDAEAAKYLERNGFKTLAAARPDPDESSADVVAEMYAATNVGQEKTGR